MYIRKDPVRGYNEYLNADVNNGEGTYMDVGLLVMEDSDVFEFHEDAKEMAWILLCGKATVEFDSNVVDMDRPNPFEYSTYCLHLSAGGSCTITAHSHCEFYVQKTYNDKHFENHLYQSNLLQYILQKYIP